MNEWMKRKESSVTLIAQGKFVWQAGTENKATHLFTCNLATFDLEFEWQTEAHCAIF